MLQSTVVLSASLDDNLTHYWPITDCNMNDLIGNANMTQGANTTFVSDRFGNENSALNLNGGWTQVPPGIYFNSPQFTITAWVYPQSLDYFARLIDFGNGAPSDNIMFILSNGFTKQPVMRFGNGSTQIGTGLTSSPLIENKWQFLAATFDGCKIKIYIDGILKGNETQIFALPTLNKPPKLTIANQDSNEYLIANIGNNTFNDQIVNNGPIATRAMTITIPTK